MCPTAAVLTVIFSPQSDNQLRMAAYEVLNVFVGNAANDSLQIVADLSEVILSRLEATIPMQRQIVSVDDKNTLEEIQTSLTSVLLVSRLHPSVTLILTISIVHCTALRTGDCTTSRSYYADTSASFEYRWVKVQCT